MTESRRPRRSRRDWIVDSLVFVIAVFTGFLLYDDGSKDPVSPDLLAFDFVFGMALCLTLWFRRRWPVQLALVAAVIGTFSDTAGGAGIIIILTVAIHCRLRTTLLIFAVNAVSLLIYVQVRHKQETEALVVAAVAIYI